MFDPMLQENEILSNYLILTVPFLYFALIALLLIAFTRGRD